MLNVPISASAASASPTGTLRAAEALSRRRLRVQVIHHQLFRHLTRLLHLETLRNRQTSFLLCDCQYRTLHQRIHHAVLDGLGAHRRRARVEE